MIKKELGLRIPGPSPLPPAVTAAMSRPMINHRSAEFRTLWRELAAGMQQVFQTENECVILAGSGTAAMEAAVANLVAPGTPVLAVVAGKFGERWRELAKAYRAVVSELTVPQGQGVDAVQLAAAIAIHKPEVVFLTHNESSTGVRQDIAAAAAVCRAAGCLTVVDVVSSLGGAEFFTDAWGVDVAVTGAQKCLMLPPGLSFLAVSPAAWQRMATIDTSRYYLDLLKYKKSGANGETPYTPAVSLLFGLQASLQLLAEEGLARSWQRHALMQQMTRRGLQAAGLQMFVAEQWASPTVTAVCAPNGIDVEAWRKQLAADTGVILSGGQGDLAGRIFRVGHMGYCTPLEILATLGAIEITLIKVGWPAQAGAAVAAAEEVWIKWQ